MRVRKVYQHHGSYAVANTQRTCMRHEPAKPYPTIHYLFEVPPLQDVMRIIHRVTGIDVSVQVKVRQKPGRWR